MVILDVNSYINIMVIKVNPVKRENVALEDFLEKRVKKGIKVKKVTRGKMDYMVNAVYLVPRVKKVILVKGENVVLGVSMVKKVILAKKANVVLEDLMEKRAKKA